jgi:hypothetical protein
MVLVAVLVVPPPVRRRQGWQKRLRWRRVSTGHAELPEMVGGGALGGVLVGPMSECLQFFSSVIALHR